MGGKIECFLDISSYFSYVAFADLAQNRDKLAANGVDIEIHPVFLGGINNLSDFNVGPSHITSMLTDATCNNPPWTNKAKAKYLQHDSRRAAHRVGLVNVRSPPDLMAVGLTISPLRALHYIKANYPRDTFLAAMEACFIAFWTPPNVNLISEENLRAVLQGATEKPGKSDSRKLFTEDEVERIMQSRGSMKDVLLATTKRAVDLGAFGAPWFWVTNGKGEQEPFFGSDRFNHIYKFLDVPFQDIALLTPAKL